MQLLLCSCLLPKNVSHFSLFISFMTEKTFSTPDPWLPSYVFLQTTGGSYLRSFWHCSFWCSAFGKKNNLISTFLPRTRSVSFPHTVTFTQWVPLTHGGYDRDPLLRQLLQLTDQPLHRWARPRVPIEVISEDERTLHNQLQPHQVSQLVEAQQVFLWFPAEKSAGNRTGLVYVPQEQVHNVL